MYLQGEWGEGGKNKHCEERLVGTRLPQLMGRCEIWDIIIYEWK
jgi:hypothetical protein